MLRNPFSGDYRGKKSTQPIDIVSVLVTGIAILTPVLLGPV
jgi:hypothetical protein